MPQHLHQRANGRAAPVELPLLGSREGPDGQLDVMTDQPVKHPVGGAQFLELVEDQPDDISSLLIGIEVQCLRAGPGANDAR
jgi:hypothetical protein